MMKRICLALFAASLAFPAYAATKCVPMDKSKFPAGMKFTILTPGQTHFVQGAFTAIPPIGPPPGDGAMLIQTAKANAYSVIAFTSGKLVCKFMPVVSDFVQTLLKVGTGPLENAAPPPPSHEGELKL